MPAFHCPMGAVYYDDEPCIDCGLCSAKTREAMVEASKKIREYFSSHAARNGLSKKIAVCGKGGTGKSTVVALMANALRKEGYLVLVVDTDESNPGLHRMLGFDRQPTPLMALLDRFSPDEARPATDWLRQEKISLQEIPREYLLGSYNLKFLMAGKIDDPFQGCACSMADIARDFVERLALKDKEVVLIDMEAGIESFGRGVERGVDTVLIVVEPSFESLSLAGKINYMAGGIGVSRVRAIPNKIPSEAIERKIIDELEKREIKTIGTVYLDPRISEAGLEGKIPPDSSSAGEDVRRITRQLLAESQPKMAENDLSPDSVTGSLGTRFIGQRVLHYRRLASTMDTAKKEAQQGAPEGTIVVADEQTAGKGRIKRVWLTPEGNIAVSIILYPAVAYLPYLVMLASLAVARSIEGVTGLKTQIKWPNDVLVNGKKVCGILTESDVRGDVVNYAIIGIGMNVNLKVSDFPEIARTATSLAAELGRDVSLLEIMRRLLVEVERLYLAAPVGEAIYEEWRDRLVTLGGTVQVRSGKNMLEGIAESVDRDGGLLLRQPDGSSARIIAGDVTLRDTAQ